MVQLQKMTLIYSFFMIVPGGLCFWLYANGQTQMSKEQLLEADPRVRAEHEFRTQSDLEAAKRSKMDEILFGNLGNDALKGNWGQGTFGSKDPGRGRAERRD